MKIQTISNLFLHQFAETKLRKQIETLLYYIISKSYIKISQLQKITHTKISIMIEVHSRTEPNPKSRLQFLLKQRYDFKKQSLSLYKCKEWRDIIQSGDWSNITILILTHNEINDEDVAFVAGRPWPNLTQLWLNDNKITDTGVESLVKLDLPKLKDLSLYDNKICKIGFQLILSQKKYSQLTTLNLGLNVNKKMDTGILMPADVINIQHLDLSNNKMGPNGMKLLTKVNIPNLNKLIIGQNYFGDEGTKYLIKGRWPNLEQLEAGYNKINLSGFMTFNESHWKKLKKINMFYNEISAIAITKLLLLDVKIQEEKIILWGMKNEDLDKKAKAVLQMTKPNSEKERGYRNRYY